jgi:hypothetical protein
MDHDHPNPNLHDDPSASPLILGTILGIVLTFVTIVGSAALYFREEERMIKTVVQQPGKMTVQELHAAQQNKLMAAPGWVDKAKQTVTLPIDAAMKSVLKEYADGRAPVSAPASRP